MCVADVVTLALTIFPEEISNPSFVLILAAAPTPRVRLRKTPKSARHAESRLTEPVESIRRYTRGQLQTLTLVIFNKGGGTLCQE